MNHYLEMLLEPSIGPDPFRDELGLLLLCAATIVLLLGYYAVVKLMDWSGRRLAAETHAEDYMENGGGNSTRIRSHP